MNAQSYDLPKRCSTKITKNSRIRVKSTCSNAWRCRLSITVDTRSNLTRFSNAETSRAGRQSANGGGGRADDGSRSKEGRSFPRVRDDSCLTRPCVGNNLVMRVICLLDLYCGGLCRISLSSTRSSLLALPPSRLLVYCHEQLPSPSSVVWLDDPNQAKRPRKRRAFARWFKLCRRVL